jgi:hypothetical protein
MSADHAPSISPTPMRAGGRATEAGMDFQAAVATWFAVHILVRMPVGRRFGIDGEALPVAIRLETGDGLDDIEVSLSDSGVLQIQCKTSANLGTGAKAPLTKTLGQLARWVADAKAAGGLPDPTRNAALLAVRDDASRALDALESGCRAFDLGGTWAVTRPQRNLAERGALDTFETILTPAWTEHRGSAPDDSDLTDLARIFHLARFAMDEGDADWREASRLLGGHLFGSESAGDAPLRDLKKTMRTLIGNGAPADRQGLLRALRRLGHRDVGAPGYDADVAKLRVVTDSELARLAVHGHLPLGDGVPILRESDAPLAAAIMAGSLLVVGEPGAGKTGALVHAATTISAAGNTVVFLSVDRYPGLQIAADLASELELAHPVADVLEAMPGAGRKVLFVDALDAARGGAAEGVFAALIETVRERLANDWVVVASIRTFDLKNGRRFRQAFVGTPADINYSDSSLPGVRHFLIPRLRESDLAAAGAASPQLNDLLAAAPLPLAELLRNIFNLSLAAELLADGTDPAMFIAVRTQSGLIDAYEDARLTTTALQHAAATAAATMANKRRLSVRKVAIGHAALDEVIRSGVLAEAGDLVSFAHHVLFDHVTGRFYLDWEDPDGLLAQLAGDTSSALMLAPAFRFAVERLWRNDKAGKQRSWQLLVEIFAATSVDPVLGNIALRVIVENIEDEHDIAGILTRVAASPSSPVFAVLLGRLARFVAMEMSATRSVQPARTMAWARLASALVEHRERALMDAVRMLLQPLSENSELGNVALLGIFGQAARGLLEFAWAQTPPLVTYASIAIRFVGKSFSSNPIASRVLLDQILREPHFSQYADLEALWLAENIVNITQADPEFTVEIYAALYGQTINDNSTSWFGGQPSRIMPLSSNRKQDYESCLWRLGTAMRQVLDISPYYGTRALIDALIGKAATKSYGGYHESHQINVGTTAIELRGRQYEFNAWEGEREERVHDDDVLAHYVRFLRACDVHVFATSVEAASADYATASVWARILGVGCERAHEVGDLLWPVIELPGFLEHGATLRDAVRFIAAAWTSRSHDARVRFETMALDESRFNGMEEELHQWHRLLGRLFTLVQENPHEQEPPRPVRRQHDAQGFLITNEPTRRLAAFVDRQPDIVRDRLNRNGVATDSGPIREILDASTALYSRLERTPSDSEMQYLAALWDEAMVLLTMINANPGLPDEAECSVWGHISNAVERVASSSNYVPSADGLPSLDSMFKVLERLSSSQYPRPSSQEI